MMKKVLTLILCFLMLFSLCACGEASESTATTTVETVVTTTALEGEADATTTAAEATTTVTTEAKTEAKTEATTTVVTTVPTTSRPIMIVTSEKATTTKRTAKPTSAKKTTVATTAAPKSPFTYIVENGKVTITGYESNEMAVVIPETIEGCPVTEIGGTAFCDMAITSIVIPNGVERIGNSAFWGCYRLETMTVPSTLKIVEHDAFYNCDALKTVNYGGSMAESSEIVFGERNGKFEGANWVYAK